MKKTLILAAVAAFTLSSCSKDTPVDVTGTNEALGNEISFRTTLNKSDDAIDDPQTRVAHANALDLNNFTLFAKKWSSNTTGVKGAGFDFMNFFSVGRQQNIGAPSGGDRYVYYPIKHYPSTTGEGISFFAYTPAGSISVSGDNVTQPHAISGATGDAATMVFDYTVPVTFVEERQNQEDFLVAAYKQSSAVGGAVKLNFKHALASISFAASNLSEGTGFVAHKIELINFANTATLTLSPGAVGTTASSFTWSSVAGTQTYPGNTSPYIRNKTYTVNILGYGDALTASDGFSIDSIKQDIYAGAYIPPRSNGGTAKTIQLTSSNEHLMMLPQRLQASNNGSGMLELTEPTVQYKVNEVPSDLTSKCYIKITFSSFEGDMNWIYRRAFLYLRMPNPAWEGVYTNYPSVINAGSKYKFTYTFDQNAAGSPITIDPGITVDKWVDGN